MIRDPVFKGKFGFFGKRIYICSPFSGFRGVAQLASAPALGAGGPVFESRYPDRKREWQTPFPLSVGLRGRCPLTRSLRSLPPRLPTYRHRAMRSVPVSAVRSEDRHRCAPSRPGGPLMRAFLPAIDSLYDRFQIILKVREVFNDYLPDHFHVDLVVIVDQHVPEAFYGLPVH